MEMFTNKHTNYEGRKMGLKYISGFRLTNAMCIRK